MHRIPRKIRTPLENKYGTIGHGICAVSSWAIWKVMLAIFLIQIGPSVFAIRWLCEREGGFQNAFMLETVLLGLLNLLIMLPDRLSIRKGLKDY